MSKLLLACGAGWGTCVKGGTNLLASADPGRSQSQLSCGGIEECSADVDNRYARGKQAYQEALTKHSSAILGKTPEPGQAEDSAPADATTRLVPNSL
jgi:hypothetical protein